MQEPRQCRTVGPARSVARCSRGCRHRASESCGAPGKRTGSELPSSMSPRADCNVPILCLFESGPSCCRRAEMRAHCWQGPGAPLVCAGSTCHRWALRRCWLRWPAGRSEQEAIP